MQNAGKTWNRIWSIFALLLLLCTLTSCTPEHRRFDGPSSAVPTAFADSSLYEQQAAAYPWLEESDDVLVLCDFEEFNQVDHFQLAPTSSVLRSRRFHCTSSSASGRGSLGVELADPGVTSVVFTPNIQGWSGYNLWQVAILSKQNQLKCQIELTGAAGHTYRRSCLLQNGWNKVKIDLTAAAARIDLQRVTKVVFTFPDAGPSTLWFDDLILVQHRHTLSGTPNGKAGTLTAIQEGKRTRIVANERFELVFANGRIVAWYDLVTDPDRAKNLVSIDGFGPFIYQSLTDGQPSPIPDENTAVSVHSQVLSRPGAKKLKLVADTFFTGPGQTSQVPNQSFTYTISADGQVDMQLCTHSTGKRLTVRFALADNAGFDPVVGKIRNTRGPKGSKIEYALARRMGKADGSDLLVAFRPWKAAYMPVDCRLASDTAQALQITFHGDGQEGENILTGMLRVWPADIDHVGNAERYVRNFLSGPGSQTIAPPDKWRKPKWTPRWSVGE